MAIRRISELPSLQADHEGSAQLSDCLFEVSYPHLPNEYVSYYTTGREVVNGVMTVLEKESLSSLLIEGGSLTLSNAILSLDHGSSIVAWPNEPVTNTSCFLHFDHIKISAESELELDGDPVVINQHLFVYSLKSDRVTSPADNIYYVVDNYPVRFNSSSNQIKARTITYANAQVGVHANDVVTCELLNTAVIGPTATIQNLTSGTGYTKKLKEN